MNRAHKLIKNTAILSLGTVLPKLAVFITLPIYTKYLTQSEYGTYDLIATLVAFIIPFVTLQIQDAVFRNLLEKETKKEKSIIITTSFLFSIVLFTITAIIALICLNAYNIEYKILIIVYFLLEAMLTILLQITRGLKNTKEYSIGSVINSFFNIVLIIPLLINLKMGLKGILISSCVALFITIFYLIKKNQIFTCFKEGTFSKNALKELLKFSLPTVPNSIAWWILNLSDRLIVTNALGIASNAIYAAANKIPSIYNIAYNTFSLAWQESASIEQKSKDVNTYYSTIFKSLFEFLLGAILIIISISPILFKILLNNTYQEAFYQMPILFLGMFFYSLANFYGGIYVAIKETKKLAISSIIAAIINIMVNLLLIKIIGIYAASISTMIAYLVVTIYRYIDIQHKLSLNYNKKLIVIGISLLILECILIYFYNWYFYILNIIICSSIFIVLNYKKILDIGTTIIKKIGGKK